MTRSTVCSSIVVVAIGFLCLATPARASSETEDADAPPNSSLRIYGAYLPDRVEWNDTHWGFGLAARTSLSSRWGVDVGAARFTSSDRALTPMTVGFAYGAEPGNGPRPWLEFGAGLYRLESTISQIVLPADPYNTYRMRRPEIRRNNAGGYLGAGLDVPFSDRVGLGTSVRIHAWSYPDALIALQSGLTIGF